MTRSAITNDVGRDSAPETFLREQMVPDHEPLNEQLRALLLDHASRLPDKGTNTAGGQSYFRNKWLSANDLHLLRHGALQTLVAFIGKAVNEARPGGDPLRIASMWTIVSRQGMEGAPHNHKGRVSGAYYVDAGDGSETGQGAFAVHDRTGKVVRLIQPRAGLMLLFPSAMWHSVRRYESAHPRIVVSFNLS
jgi:uncharacterized protein (TIGR02466 family)